MSKPKKPQQTSSTMPLAKRADYEGAPARITRTGGVTMANFDWRSLPRPAHRFSVDLADVMARQGQPEVLLVQTDPFDELQVRRVVTVRYELNRFIERAEHFEEFRQSMVEYLENHPQKSGLHGPAATPSLKSLKSTGDHDSVKIDAEAEWMFRRDHWCHTVFVSMYGRDIHRVVVGQSDELPVQSILEAVMPCRVMAGLLDSWKNLALELGNG